MGNMQGIQEAWFQEEHETSKDLEICMGVTLCGVLCLLSFLSTWALLLYE